MTTAHSWSNACQGMSACKCNPYKPSSQIPIEGSAGEVNLIVDKVIVDRLIVDRLIVSKLSTRQS